MKIVYSENIYVKKKKALPLVDEKINMVVHLYYTSELLVKFV